MSSRSRDAMPRDAASRDALTLELLNTQLDRYQAVISRLAGNQVQVKTWCVTALGALAALAIDRRERPLLVIGIILVLAFFFLDSYYLSLERHFRNRSRQLADEVLRSHGAARASLFLIEGPAQGRRQSWRAVMSCGGSLAVSPFYLALLMMLAVGIVATR